MRKWHVIFEVFKGTNREMKSVDVEAGTKKLAMLRAMSEINKIDGYSNLFKQVYSIEEEKHAS